MASAGNGCRIQPRVVIYHAVKSVNISVCKLKVMKRFLILIFLAVSLVSFACTKTSSGKNDSNHTNPNDSTMNIKIGNRTFTVTLYDNPTTTAFKSLLPMTVQMVDLNSNEKYVDLPRTLPTNASNPGTIQNGDLMLYGSSTLVLFYKTFSTSYSYTKLGRIDDTTGLAAALGSGNVRVTYELIK